MVSVTLSVTEEFKDQLKRFSWVNWSEIAKEETLKKIIFQRYLEKGIISDEDWQFCEKIDWHPVDELPVKLDLLKSRKEKSIKVDSVSQLFR